MLRGGQINGLGRARRRKANAQCQRDGGGYAGSLGKEAPPPQTFLTLLVMAVPSFLGG